MCDTLVGAQDQHARKTEMMPRVDGGVRFGSDLSILTTGLIVEAEHMYLAGGREANPVFPFSVKIVDEQQSGTTPRHR